jgi:hypothetical protein
MLHPEAEHAAGNVKVVIEYWSLLQLHSLPSQQQWQHEIFVRAS